jgi:hypothetical protein
MKALKVAVCLLALLLTTPRLAADGARFDLTGPKLDIRVTRGNSTLPISQVPNLQTGDRIWVKADLPHTQSNHLLLIVAFLRGTTNVPPDKWFTEIDTWDKKTAEGTTVTVPEGAQQALLFIAPETGGDFKTLRSAVKGRPGLFIRTDADLNEASFEQQRIEHYLAAMQTVPQNDQKAIQDHSAKLAATLALKPNADCFKQPVDQQVSCLTQTSAPLLLDDGHGESIAEALSTGASSDFITAAATTPLATASIYSAYVGAVVDLVQLVSLLRTAQYQYIPGLSFPQGQTLHLKLNAPPSFVNPKTVIVIGLPEIQKAKLPPLHPPNPDEVACLLQPDMALQLQGAPLVFSTSYAHDLILHLNRTGAVTDIPLTADAYEGGLIIDKGEQQRKPLLPADLQKADTKPAQPAIKIGSASDLTITGTVRGYWGFDAFEGPTLTLQQIDGKGWKIVGDTQLLAGQDNHLTLKADSTACVQHIALTTAKNKDLDVTFKPAADKAAKDTLDLDVSLKKVQPGGYALAVQQYGDPNRDNVPLTAYTGDIHLDGIAVHTGDNTAILTGQGLQNVASVQIANQTFTPTTGDNTGTTLHLQAKAGVSPTDGSDATAKLKDGRSMTVKISAEAARPGLQLLSSTSTPTVPNGTLPITLGATKDIPLNGRLIFVVETSAPFPTSQTIEVATASKSAHTILSFTDNTLVLQDDHTAIATLDPLKAFGQSAFGKLQMRPVAEDGTPGDWTPLGTLVRTPQITAIHCTTGDAPTCTVDGSNFFLVQSFSATKDFAKPANVPTGFADNTFTIPTPADGTTLYLKLRDDPSTIATVTLPTPIQKTSPPPATPAQATPPPSNTAPAPTDQTPQNQPTQTAPPTPKPTQPSSTPTQPSPKAR